VINYQQQQRNLLVAEFIFSLFSLLTNDNYPHIQSINFSQLFNIVNIGIIDQTESLLLYKNFYSVHLQLHNHNLTITLTPIFDLLEIKLM